MFGSALGALHCSFLILRVIASNTVFRVRVDLLESIGEGHLLAATTVAAITIPLSVNSSAINLPLGLRPGTGHFLRFATFWRGAGVPRESRYC